MRKENSPYELNPKIEDSSSRTLQKFLLRSWKYHNGSTATISGKFQSFSVRKTNRIRVTAVVVLGTCPLDTHPFATDVNPSLALSHSPRTLSYPRPAPRIFKGWTSDKHRPIPSFGNQILQVTATLSTDDVAGKKFCSSENSTGRNRKREKGQKRTSGYPGSPPGGNLGRWRVRFVKLSGENKLSFLDFPKNREREREGHRKLKTNKRPLKKFFFGAPGKGEKEKSRFPFSPDGLKEPTDVAHMLTGFNGRKTEDEGKNNFFVPKKKGTTFPPPQKKKRSNQRCHLFRVLSCRKRST